MTGRENGKNGLADVKDFLLTDGFSPQEMLGDTLPPALPVALPPEPGDHDATVPLGALVPEAGAPAFTAEITLRPLELTIAEAGLAMERTLVETKERALNAKREHG